MGIQEKEGVKVVSKYVYRAVIIVLTIVILSVTLITVVSTIKSSGNLAFFKNKFYIMKDEYAGSIASKGDLLIAKEIDVSELNPGDKIICLSGNSYVCCEITEIEKLDSKNKIMIDGRDGKNHQFDIEQMQGKVVANIHALGNLIVFFKSIVGVIVFSIIVVFLFSFLRKLFKEKVV